MRWMIPINQLDSQQTATIDAVVNGVDETHWIAGYAGTGKTIVLTHAMSRIASAKSVASIGFLTYTHALKDMVESGLKEKTRKQIKIRTIKSFQSTPQNFDHLFVDEIQDVEEDEIETILNSSSHVVVAGDPDQSIYKGRVNQEDINTLLQRPNKYLLSNVYRLSQNSFDIAMAINPAAKLVRGAALREDDDTNARLCRFDNAHDEAVAIYAEATRVSEEELPSAILFPTHNAIYNFVCEIASDEGWVQPPKPTKILNKWDYSHFNSFLKSKDSPLMFLGSDNGSFFESDQREIIYLMTYHSSKGLDFAHTFIPQLNTKAKIKQNWDSIEDARRLFFVAATRSRYQQYFSYYDEMHQFLEDIEHLLDEVNL